MVDHGCAADSHTRHRRLFYTVSFRSVVVEVYVAPSRLPTRLRFERNGDGPGHAATRLTGADSRNSPNWKYSVQEDVDVVCDARHASTPRSYLKMVSKLVTTNVDAVSVTSMPASWPEASNMWRSTKRTNRVSIDGKVRVLATSRVDATKQEAPREGPSALRVSPKVHETALHQNIWHKCIRNELSPAAFHDTCNHLSQRNL